MFMKYMTFIIGQIFGIFFVLAASAQGTFQNLNFEEAMPNQFNGTISAAQAIPDWTAEIAGVEQTEILQNGFSTGAPEVSLITPNPQYPPLDGNYSVLLTGTGETASITQMGLIPTGTETMFFDSFQGGPGNLLVSVGTQSVGFSAVAKYPGYTVYGANISAWAGTTEAIAFTASTTTIGINNWEIDDISFSPGAIPEPNPFVLTGLGALLFGLYRRRRGKV
jgi:hypothetical protein